MQRDTLIHVVLAVLQCALLAVLADLHDAVPRQAGAKDNGEAKYDSVTGAKDYRWLESEMVYNLHLEETIDRSYFDKMATKAVEAISEYGDFEQFASNDLGEPPWQKPDIPWDDVQDEAAQNFDVR